MLIGEYQHNIDQKGRLIMPAKFREDIGNHFYVTKAADGCLRAYSFDDWSNYIQKLDALPDSDKMARLYKREILSNSVECEVDKQGRILISTKLRNFAGLEKDVVIIGQSTYIEFWSKDAWDKYQSTEEVNLDGLAEMMSSYGL